MVSLRGGEARRRRPLPPSLPGPGALRHELPAPMANRLLCAVLEQLALKVPHRLTSKSDALVVYGERRYRLVGDLLHGTLYDVAKLTPRYHVEGGLLRPPRADFRWKADPDAPGVSALERVSYVMPWEAVAPVVARAVALPL